MDISEKILRFLVENNSNSYTIKELSDKLNLDYKNLYQNVKKLESLNLLDLNKVGNTSQVKFNFKFSSKVYQVETKRREELMKNKNIKLIQNRVDKINYPFIIVLLFGSITKKENNKHSDIDMCIICDNKTVTKNLEDKLSTLSLNIDINSFTTKQIQEMNQTTKFNVFHEIKNNNIILKGIENYYNLVRYE